MMKTIEGAALLKAIDAWAKAGAKWADQGQALGLSALKALRDSGDIGPANRLLCAMPKGTKVTSMKSWLIAHSSLIDNQGEDKADKPMIHSRDKADEMGTRADVEAAAQDKWVEHKPEKAADEVFDLQKALLGIIAKAGKAKQVAHVELLAQVQALVATPEDTDPLKGLVLDGKDAAAM